MTHLVPVLRSELKEVLRKLLIVYLTSKNDIIRRHTGIDYVDKNDIKDVESWPISTIIKIIKSFGSDNSDQYTCPWCIIHRRAGNGCSKCTYGKRNIVCKYPKSRYNRIIKILYEKNLIQILPLIPPLNIFGYGLCDVKDIEDLNGY